jgi:ornithine cyclodeaminase
MPGYVPGQGLAAKLVSVFADRAASGRSAHRGIVALFDEADGRPLAVMDAASLTAARTAASATLSMRALARAGARRCAVVGTGVQARAQLDLLAALGRLTPNTPVVVAGRSAAAAQRLAARYPNASAAPIEEAVRSADVVFCCTDAREPVLARDWLAPGTHVSSVGGSHGPELDPATVADAALYAEWDGAAGSAPPAGAHELQGVDPSRVGLLGTVLAGGRPRPGAGDRPALTVFKSTGHAALDVAAASVVYARARELGLGSHLDL